MVKDRQFESECDGVEDDEKARGDGHMQFGIRNMEEHAQALERRKRRGCFERASSVHCWANQVAATRSVGGKSSKCQVDVTVCRPTAPSKSVRPVCVASPSRLYGLHHRHRHHHHHHNHNQLRVITCYLDSLWRRVECNPTAVRISAHVGLGATSPMPRGSCRTYVGGIHSITWPHNCRSMDR